MKIKKEYLIFGGVALVLVGLVSVPKLFKSDVKYDKDKITINYENSTEDELDLEETNTDEEDMDESIDEEIDTQESDSVVSVNAEYKGVEDTNDSEPVDVETTEEPEVDETEYLDSDSEPEFNSTLTDDAIMSVVRFYVCNLFADDTFNAMTTKELMEDRPNRLSEEPYKSLDGVTSLESLTKDGNVVSVGTKDGRIYKFECIFNEDETRISDIVYLED